MQVLLAHSVTKVGIRVNGLELIVYRAILDNVGLKCCFVFIAYSMSEI